MALEKKPSWLYVIRSVLVKKEVDAQTGLADPPPRQDAISDLGATSSALKLDELT